MSTQTIYLLGTAKWTKVHKPDEKFNKYSLCLYPKAGSWETFRKAECPVKIRDNQDGEGEFIQLSRYHEKMWNNEVVVLGPPKIVRFNKETSEYEPFDGLIGNGSLINCKVQVYDTKRGKGHTLEAVGVEELVEYNPDTGSGEFPF